MTRRYGSGRVKLRLINAARVEAHEETTKKEKKKKNTGETELGRRFVVVLETRGIIVHRDWCE